MSDSRNAWIAVFGAVAVAVVSGVFTLLAKDPSPVVPPPSDTIRSSGNSGGTDDDSVVAVVMGPLEPGINRQGMDMSDNGISAENPETCSNMCRADGNCRSMTYVISLKTC